MPSGSPVPLHKEIPQEVVPILNASRSSHPKLAYPRADLPFLKLLSDPFVLNRAYSFRQIILRFLQLVEGDSFTNSGKQNSPLE